MAYYVSSARAGSQPIATTDTVQNHPLGTRVFARDPTYGEGEFIYLLGVISTIVGSLVTYDATTYQTALSTHVKEQARPVAVAMSANVAAQYGWYQIAGLAVIKKTAVVLAPQVTLALSATVGRVKGTSTTGMQIAGMRSANLATISGAVSTITALMERPHVQTQAV